MWDLSGLGNAIPGATPRAEIDVHAVLPDLPFFSRAAAPLPLTARVRNASARPFRTTAVNGRRVVRLGAQLLAEDGTLLDRDYARAELPADLLPGAETRMPMAVAVTGLSLRYASQ